MSFEERLEEIQKLYVETERQFQEVIHTIPIDNLPDVFSPRFYNILQFSCAQIDSLFKMICEKLKINVSSPKFPEFYSVLNKKEMLQKQEVFLFERKQFLHPFNENGKHDWWTGYNDTKHQLPEGIRQGTLGNVLDAMAAVFVLNNIANLIRYSEDVDHLLDGNNWNLQQHEKISEGVIMMMKSLNTQSPIKNSAFFYLNSQYYHKQGL